MSATQQNLLAGVPPLPSRPGRACCSHCGQRLPKVFKHVLSKGLVNFLWHLYKAGKPTKLVDLQLDNSTFANAQKTAYFRLAQSVDGYWALTDRGFWFLSNRIGVERYVHTRSGKVVEREGNVKVADIDEGWWRRIDYSREARVG